jgi:predicted kinase
MMKHISSFELFESTSKKMVLIVGLPGSGKSELTRKINSEKSYVEFDDPEEHPYDEDLDNFSENYYPQIEKALKKGLNVIINSGDFIQPHGQDLIQILEKMGKNLGYSVRKIYFENDPEQCLKNQNDRGYRIFTREEMYQASKSYKIPSDAEIVPVYKK